MRIEIKPNGNLAMDLVSPKDYQRVKELLAMDISPIEREAIFISFMIPDSFGGEGFVQVKPEDVGALTSAPLIKKGEDVWGFMDYQVKDLLEELAAGNTVVWQKG